MVKLFGQYVRSGTIALCLFEYSILAAVFFGMSGWYDPRALLSGEADLFVNFALLPSMVTWLALYSLGGYEPAAQDFLGALAHRLATASLLGFAATILLNEFALGMRYPLELLLAAYIFGYFLILGNRIVVKYGIDSNAFKPRALVLGAGRAAANLHHLSRIRTLRSVTLYGFAEINGTDDVNPKLPPAKVFSEIDNLLDFAVAHSISEIIVALDDRRGVLDVRDLLECRLKGIRVTEAATFFEREAGKVDLNHIYPSWLIYSDGFQRSWLTDPLKRLFDIAVSAAVLIGTAPIWVLTALAIKLDSPGPVFYRQVRVGFRGRPFSVLKFRSMRTDAEKAGPQFARAGDARVTRVGALIRKTRIDELPQTVNVLRGDMSFVGPRPERPNFVKEFEKLVPYYNDRHNVKPGITGWAQINYPYGDTLDDAREKLTYDLYYIKNYTLFLDMVIILKTLNIVVWKVGSR